MPARCAGAAGGRAFPGDLLVVRFEKRPGHAALRLCQQVIVGWRSLTAWPFIWGGKLREEQGTFLGVPGYAAGSTPAHPSFASPFSREKRRTVMALRPLVLRWVSVPWRAGAKRSFI